MKSNKIRDTKSVYVYSILKKIICIGFKLNQTKPVPKSKLHVLKMTVLINKINIDCNLQYLISVFI